MTGSQSLIAALHADGPPPDIAAKMNLYGQFVGPWDMQVAAFEDNGTRHAGRGEIHFGFVLEGRAVQDVWMIPRRADRRPDTPHMPVAGNWYGTTLRVYDPGLDAWHIAWSDPATGFHARRGRVRAARIVQRAGSTRVSCCAGASPTSPRPRFAGAASARMMRAPAGACRWKCSPAVPAPGHNPRRRRHNDPSRIHRGPRSEQGETLL